ncbi:exodeoxyribonuclease VII large subunit [Patescibacteria group bacterium]|nr:exodeoxyribonuclease VII large subunit [Patescibacteria group bacterium]MBU1663401.1 exodeoxyribonuclease VII large subunit [Patescibacteria group bacterium]MBU1933758.1 exodeoxyribonuclease VII large subunit [Patescibacteria group bacterium]MBU2008035.1 exodeoxyribonuclease VII large subunit [Patescibacteria group bacterium]MBU2233729.1 exodeoxyribonuclease VII large subunit [Patescibacteria group bacterium]
MSDNLLQKLKEWRTNIAQKENVASFRIFSNKVLEAIASTRPKNKDEMIGIKGIKERKFEKYGADILTLVDEDYADEDIMEDKNDSKLYTVSGFLDLINNNLKMLRTRIQGEVSSLNFKGNYLFFTLKDKEDESTLNCFMWNNNYQLYGISLEEGMEIIIDGYPSVYKPSGRLSMQISAIELVGEGALKKAYEELKAKLEKDGLFAEERKKTIPELPRNIGLITSETGAVIHDFLNNLGKFGFHIKFMDSRVEGQIAVPDLISAINYFNKQDIDALVIIRGGGSLESLQAFNNETLVRKIADCPIPIICGIGHDKDVPLASLVADMKVSTPTAVANFLNKTWEEAVKKIVVLEKDILYKYQDALKDKKYQLEETTNGLRKCFDKIFQEFNDLRYRFKNALNRIDLVIKNTAKRLDNFLYTLFKSFNLTVKNMKEDLTDSLPSLFRNFNFIIKNTTKILDDSLALLLGNLENNLEDKNNFLDDTKKRLKIFNPLRQLKLGYSIVSSGGKVIKSIKQVSHGDSVDIRVFDGKIKSTVNKN